MGGGVNQNFLYIYSYWQNHRNSRFIEKKWAILLLKCVSIVLCLVLCLLSLSVPAYFQAMPTSA